MIALVVYPKFGESEQNKGYEKPSTPLLSLTCNGYNIITSPSRFCGDLIIFFVLRYPFHFEKPTPTYPLLAFHHNKLRRKNLFIPSTLYSWYFILKFLKG